MNTALDFYNKVQFITALRDLVDDYVDEFWVGANDDTIDA